MVMRRAVIAGVAAAIVMGAGTVVGAILDTGGGGSALPDGVPIAATATLDPTVVYFGDVTTARIDVAVDSAKADPDRVRIATDFRPFERLDQKKARYDAGRITYIRETYRLRCLDRECVQVLPAVAAAAGGSKPPQRRETTLRPARVYYAGRSSIHPLLLQWPTIESVTRVNQTESQQESFFYHASMKLPDPSYAISPNGVLWLLFVAFLLALALPVVIVGRHVQAWRRSREPARQPQLPPLERALRLLEWANTQPEGKDRRRALELVAQELRRGGRGDLSVAARELAWSPPSPEPPATTDLGTRVRDATGGNGAGPA